MPNAVIVDAVRTPVGRRNGRLSGWHAVDLAAAAAAGPSSSATTSTPPSSRTSSWAAP